MEVLKCAPPNARDRFAGSTAPGQLFFPDGPVEIRLVLSPQGPPGVPADVAVEIQEITTRDPARKAKGGFTDTAGDAPLLGLEGKPVLHKFDVKLGDGPSTTVQVRDLPVPKRHGTYALVLV